MSTFTTKDNSETEAAMALFLANGGEIKRVRTANKKDLIKANAKSRYLSRNGKEDKEEENEHSLSISIFSRDERWSIK
tara:strand:+ start:111 stop:344 length:234 start_codon:yes stop_codon:yes gene_type:complete